MKGPYYSAVNKHPKKLNGSQIWLNNENPIWLKFSDTHFKVHLQISFYMSMSNKIKFLKGYFQAERALHLCPECCISDLQQSRLQFERTTYGKWTSPWSGIRVTSFGSGCERLKTRHFYIQEIHVSGNCRIRNGVFGKHAFGKQT